MSTIWLVKGNTGYGCDFLEWVVRAFATEEKAREFVEVANDWLKERGIYQDLQAYTARSIPYELRRNIHGAPFDPNLVAIDSNGAEYSVSAPIPFE